MPTRIRQLAPDEITQLTPRTFTLAPIFDKQAHYAGMRGTIFLAETDGEPSGCAAVTYAGAETGAGTGREKGTLQIDQFVVLPGFRGHGVGGRLMRTVVDHAKSLSMGTITASIPGWCPEWRAFYARFGFVFIDPTTASSTADETPVELQLE